ncbi:LLM class F420-dependent oxidoreductase [Phytomonospora endophytica]|uniref:F420-dependent oxidoreductase-like protein n=1 Tax=Phytomonospora endophytica TaxID=714109 RepID=A0A841FIP4_9ACTN|nr:LLM class F420-dependent oxidoreductase [Phytomonospora endophytica]MBB6035744.1 F420-dependent oxidoreductase-like protein [Phytomonospora endophytica]GIG69578.1 LLM class F420-dependent oxidoreductase [Phytomonospora endophytica]
MRLGLSLGYWGSAAEPAAHLALTKEAESLGYSVVWAAEAYGSDTVTMLTWLAAHTSTIDVGAGVMQIPARAATMTAMTAASLDALSGGRFRLGLGVSGPQVSEGWYGVPFAKPLGRTREYVQVVRAALAREKVAIDGEHITLPLPGGPGKALQLAMRPERPDLPIYLAVIGPKNLALAGEIADGWLAVFFAPEHAAEQLAHVRAGAAGTGRDLSAFDVVPTVPVVVGDDVVAAADPVRAYTALYLGGMGSRKQNFYNNLAHRMGFGEAADKVQDLYLERRHREAMAAVPHEFIDRVSLIGGPARIADRLVAYAEAGVTTLSITPFAATHEERVNTLRVVAEAAATAGLGE